MVIGALSPVADHRLTCIKCAGAPDGMLDLQFTAQLLKETAVFKAKLIAAAAAIALFGTLGGCATLEAGSGGTSPYAGRHDHNRDAKQGAAPSYTPTAPVTRKSLRPAS
jgi:hypothetical protein